MTSNIYPCITLKGKATEAAAFYIHTFGDGMIKQNSPYVVLLELIGERLMLLNEGPTSTPNASISFMVICETAEETDRYWSELIQGGQVFMPLDQYEWSIRYGWVQDKFGVSWQIYTGEKTDQTQKFSPTLMFTGKIVGKTVEAIELYTALYPESEVQGILKYKEGEADKPEFVKHAQFKIKGYTAMAMDSSADHSFKFNDAISFVVECDSQEEIDTYWNKLSTEGGKEVACGWLTDKFGVSWQIIPRKLGKLMNSPERAQRVMPVLLKMKKLILADLESA